MVVIVIRAEPNDSDEEQFSPRTSYAVQNTRQILVPNQCETYDESESWPSSHDSEFCINTKSNVVNGNVILRNKSLERMSRLSDQENVFTQPNIEKFVAQPRKIVHRLDSPLSKDSGFSDKTYSNQTMKRYKNKSEDHKKWLEQGRVQASPLTDEFIFRDSDNSSIAYLSCSSQVDPEDSVTTKKEEEWITKRKIELTTTRQIETRVKRQVVLEDGKIIEDSGPMITTNTTEDTDRQEHNQTEHRTIGDDEIQGACLAIPNTSNAFKEVQEKTVKTREETKERTETEDVKHLGDISDEGYMTAVKSGNENVRQILEKVSNNKDLISCNPKIIHQSRKTTKYIDTEDKTELSQIDADGKLINETRTNKCYEEIGNYNISDDESSNSSNSCDVSKKENYQKYYRTKDEDLTEYRMNGQKIGEKLHFQAETSGAERRGNFDTPDEINISSKLKNLKMRSLKSSSPLHNEINPNIFAKKPVNYDKEEETRKEETSKWLEDHFGSESTKSSKSSMDNLESIVPSSQNSFINVTMKSQLLKSIPKIKFAGSDDEEIPFTNNNEEYYSLSHPRSENTKKFTRYLEKKDSDDLSSLNQSYPSRSLSPVTIRSIGSSRLKSPVGSEYSKIPWSKTEREEYLSADDQREPSPGNHFITVSPIRREPPRFQSSPFKRPDSSREDREDETTEKERDDIYYQYGSKPNESRGISPPSLENESMSFRPSPNKKYYQRTRFAADIPPPPQPAQPPVKQKSKIGESFRKLVGKLRSSSSDRKNKKRLKSNESRSPSPKENTYQNYNSLDNYDNLLSKSALDLSQPVAPPRTKHNSSHWRSRGEGNKLLQRYYLGEDPMESIYGREKEYDKNYNKTNNSKQEEIVKMEIENDFKSSTLDRFNKSTNRLHNLRQTENYLQHRKGIHTLPRKFLDENKEKKNNHEKQTLKGNFTSTPIYLNEKRRNQSEKDTMPHARSLINVSFVNQAYPLSSAKDYGISQVLPQTVPNNPGRNHQSSLLRSQSFNAQFKPSFNNQGLTPSPTPPPLKSPGMISQWSQSSHHHGGEKFIKIKTKDYKGYRDGKTNLKADDV